jgi:uncharacterized membrane protein YqjE
MNAANRSNPAGFENLSTPQLVGEVAAKVTLLVRTEIELARSEIRKDFESELSMAKALGLAAVFAITTLNLLLVAGVFALTAYLDGWIAALVVAGGTLLMAGLLGAFGWSRRVTQPLERTRRTLKEDTEWVKEQIA